MLNISNNGIVTMTRGDCFKTSLYINMGTELQPIQYVLREGDVVYFGVEECKATKGEDAFCDFNNALIRKKFTKANLDEDGDVEIEFHSADTENVLPGTYWYEIKIQFANGCINTIVPKTQFIIVE